MPFIIITGDVHHYFRGNWIRDPEHIFLRSYLDIVVRYDYTAILFVTGRLLEVESKFFDNILKEYNDSVEIQPHTYSAFSSLSFRLANLLKKFRIERKVLSSYIAVWKEVYKVLKVFYDLGFEVYAWRTHSYVTDPLIYSCIISSIKGDSLLIFDLRAYLEDPLQRIKAFRVKVGNKLKVMAFVPINVPVDDYVIVCIRRKRPRDVVRYVRLTKKTIEYLIRNNTNIVVQIHPSVSRALKHILISDILKEVKDNNYKPLKVRELARKIHEVYSTCMWSSSKR